MFPISSERVQSIRVRREMLHVSMDVPFPFRSHYAYHFFFESLNIRILARENSFSYFLT